MIVSQKIHMQKKVIATIYMCQALHYICHLIFRSIISTSLYIYEDIRIERDNKIRSGTLSWSSSYFPTLYRWSLINICQRNIQDVQREFGHQFNFSLCSFIYLPIQQMPIQYLQYARLYSKCQKYRTKQTKISAFMGFLIQ